MVENTIRKALDTLEFTRGEEADMEAAEAAACAIAASFGYESKFKKLLGVDSPERAAGEKALRTSFTNNLGLLIEKTWVEKSDAALKTQVLTRLTSYCDNLAKGLYFESRYDFMDIINDAVYLMFGPQSKDNDFEDYALRIDPDFGTFWQFTRILYRRENSGLMDVECVGFCRMNLQLGMFFVANY
jgi:hypothetical protein